MSQPITAAQFHEADGVEDRRVVGEGTDAYFRTGSFAAGARFVQAIGELAGLQVTAARRPAAGPCHRATLHRRAGARTG